jgi:hypothetical protein
MAYLPAWPPDPGLPPQPDTVSGWSRTTDCAAPALRPPSLFAPGMNSRTPREGGEDGQCEDSADRGAVLVPAAAAGEAQPRRRPSAACRSFSRASSPGSTTRSQSRVHAALGMRRSTSSLRAADEPGPRYGRIVAAVATRSIKTRFRQTTRSREHWPARAAQPAEPRSGQQKHLHLPTAGPSVARSWAHHMHSSVSWTGEPSQYAPCRAARGIRGSGEVLTLGQPVEPPSATHCGSSTTADSAGRHAALGLIGRSGGLTRSPCAQAVTVVGAGRQWRTGP